MATDAAPLAPPDVLDSRDAGRRFVRGGGMRMIAYAGAILLSVAALPLVTRHLHAVSYGRYVTVTSLMLIMAAVFDGGLALVGIRQFTNAPPAERRNLLRDLLGLRLALSGSGAVAAVLFALAAGYPPVEVAGTAIASIGVVLATFQATLAIPLNARLRLGWIALLDFTGPAVTATGLILLVVVGASLLPFYIAGVLAFAVTTLITTALVRGEVTVRPAFDPRRWLPLLRESAMLAASTALGVVYFQVVQVAMSLLTNPREVGIFGLAFRILSVVNGIPLVVVASAYPILVRAARDDRARLRFALNRLIEGNLLLGGWLSLLVVCGAGFGEHVIGGDQYPGSARVLEILGGGITATFLAATFSIGLLAVRSYRTLAVTNAVVALLAIALCAVLVPPHGAQGAAIVTLTLEVVMAVSYGGTLFMTHPSLRPTLARSARILLALGVAFAVALALPVSSFVSAVAGTLVLGMAVILLRALPGDLRETFRPSS